MIYFSLCLLVFIKIVICSDNFNGNNCGIRNKYITQAVKIPNSQQGADKTMTGCVLNKAEDDRPKMGPYEEWEPKLVEDSVKNDGDLKNILCHTKINSKKSILECCEYLRLLPNNNEMISNEGNYHGEVDQNILPDGFGEMKYHRKGPHSIKSYCGHWKQGKRSGFGFEVFYDGGWFEGYFKNDFYHGNGTRLFKPRKLLYIGEWKQGIMYGHGKMKLMLSNAIIEGEFRKVTHGNMTVSYGSGDHYYGEMKHLKRDGFGIYDYNKDQYFHPKNAVKCIGFFENNFMKNATCFYNNGNKYTGQFNKHSEKHGYGRGKNMKLGIYEGFYKHGRKHGNGTMKYLSGAIYQGEFKNNRKNGYGVGTSKDRKRSYAGEWRNGKWHGLGRLVIHISANETEIKEGQFRNGNFIGR